LSGLSARQRPEFDVMRGFVVAGLVVFHSALAFASGSMSSLPGRS
jgi:peptidoglycan/LPS O-acetylase OafA/YrhL